jgi:hypothetical protein
MIATLPSGSRDHRTARHPSDDRPGLFATAAGRFAAVLDVPAPAGRRAAHRATAKPAAIALVDGLRTFG